MHFTYFITCTVSFGRLCNTKVDQGGRGGIFFRSQLTSPRSLLFGQEATSLTTQDHHRQDHFFLPWKYAIVLK